MMERNDADRLRIIVTRMRGAVRIYNRSTTIEQRDVAAARVVYYLGELESAGAFGPSGTVDVPDADPEDPVPYTLTLPAFEALFVTGTDA